MLEKINYLVFNYLNHLVHLNPLIDQIIIILAKYWAFIFVFWLIYLWLKKDQFRQIALFSGYAAILGLIINFIITLFYRHPRPFMLHMGTTLIYHAAEASFPSDTTTFMLSIACLLFYFSETRISGIFLFITGLISGFCRVISGIHFPLDIFGSLVVAIIASFAVYTYQSKLRIVNRVIINIYQSFLKWIADLF